jgi:pyruvate carboxylase
MSTLPTSVFFYGMQAGQEINVDLERGKTLIVRYVATSDAHEDGTRTVFFELNGQPRPIRVADRSQVPKRPALAKAEPGNPAHIGAPMPGTIVTVPVHAGQRIARGEILLTLEAMKMETTVRAERDGIIKQILVGPGLQIDTKDLLIVLE